MSGFPQFSNLLCFTLLFISHLLPGSARAADARGVEDGSYPQPIEEIVTYAQKRAQAVQDIPVSIAAIDGSLLEQRAAEGLQQVGYWQPNVRLSPQTTVPHLANFYIRGMGLNGSVISDEPAVGVFVDGVYLGTSAGVVTDLVDLASVEVMRGPQGTLYGHSTTAGVVSLHSRPPEFEPALAADVKIGNNNLRSLGATVTGGLGRGNRWAGRLTVHTTRQDGSFRNIAPTAGSIGADIGAADLTVIKPSLRWRGGGTQAVLRLEDGRSTNTVGPRRALLSGTDDVVEQLYAQHPDVPPPAEDELSLNYTPRTDGDWQHAILTVDHNLANGALKSVTAYREYHQEVASDVDGSPFSVFALLDDTAIGQRQISQELVFNSSGSRWATTTGAYFFKQNIDYQEHRFTQPAIGRFVEEWSASDLQHTSLSVYAYSDVDITNRLRVGAGVRYNRERKEADFAQRSRVSPAPCPDGFSSCVPTFQDSHTWRNWVPRAAVQWFVNDESNLYASVSRGFRSGGYNIRAVLPAAVGPYEAENVTAYEVGYKSKWRRHAVSVNLTGFHNVYDDLQKTVIGDDGNQAILNAAEATIQGVELEAEWRPLSYLTVNASLGRMWAGYQSFDGLDVDGDGVPDPERAKRLRLTDTPDWSASLQIGATGRVGEVGIDVHLDYAFTSGFMTNEVNSIGVSAHRLFNASVGFRWAQHWGLRLFARNLLDEAYYHSAFATGCCDLGDRGPRRQIGAGLRYSL